VDRAADRGMRMRALVALTVVMGVLIVVGLGVVAATIMHRMAGPVAPGAALAGVAGVLDEPAGTHMAGISAVGDRLAVLLQGGGADRVVFVDAQGRVAGRVSLKR
jgi:hypothetical protein